MNQTETNEMFCRAARVGNLDVMERLLAAGADVNYKEDGKYPVLNRAAREGQVGSINFLLQNGAMLDVQDCVGDTPLNDAARTGMKAAVIALLEAGADASIPNHKGLTPAQVADNEGKATIAEMIKSLTQLREARRAELAQEVTVSRPFGNRILEETYCFAEKERISLIRKGAGGPVEGLCREAFSAIPESALRRAFDIYKERGGKIAENDIVSSGPVKPHVLKKSRAPANG